MISFIIGMIIGAFLGFAWCVILSIGKDDDDE
jgi:hypothetical protein